MPRLSNLSHAPTRRSSSASSISSGSGQLRPATAARRTYSPTAVLPIPVASPTRRRLIPIACVSRSTSRIFLIDTLSAGIGHLLVARKTDQLIRLSTGAISTLPSPAVRNHRIAVRLALEPVSALHRVPHKDLVSLPEPSTGGCRGWGGSSSDPAITCGSVLSSQGQCPNSASTRAGVLVPFDTPTESMAPF